jgi:beta-phosphoglucomutase
MRDDPEDFLPPGGETLGDVQRRVWPQLERIAEENLGKTVLLVAHHSVNKCLLLKMLNASLTNFKVLRQPPCTVSVMEFGKNFRYVQAINLNWQERVSPWHDMEDDIKAKITDPDAVIFDMDGVLLNSMPVYVAAWRAALARFGVYPDEIEFLRREGEQGTRSIEYFFANAGVEMKEGDAEEVLFHVKENYLTFKGAALFPDVAGILKRIKDTGRKIALVTGSPRYNLDKYFGSDLQEAFDAIITGEDVEHGKPHPEPYAKAVEQLGVAGEKCLVVENAPFGIASAKAAGLFTAAVTSTLPRESLAKADVVVDSLERIIGWMGV